MSAYDDATKALAWAKASVERMQIERENIERESELLGFEALLAQAVRAAGGRRPEVSLGHIGGAHYMALCALLGVERNGIHASTSGMDIIWAEVERDGVRFKWQASADDVAAASGANGVPVAPSDAAAVAG